MKKNDSSKIVTLAGEFKNQLELKNYCESLYKLNEASIKEIERLKAENQHLQGLLKSSVPSIFNNVEPLTDEEIICLNQIEKLKNTAGLRELSLDEVKKLDLLYKNLRLIRGQATSNIKDLKPAIPVATQDLMLIASSSSDESNGRK